ncbi:PaaI family thioesterase [Tianweitania sp. Rool2]|uniref:PaaI family thioesterase n=2 Tax=Oryzicola mucosus TaxID=2767425 RepID=A0A8J6PZS0_9HYPH|nr:PaaI family thioesterase [Oryzicola mucosus]MBD0417362.1 PaaI family thioesterase [Oryzicola mucosus]
MADRCPFNAWLGLHIVSVGHGELELTAVWRDEMMGAPERKLIHGGVLASLIDAGGDYAVATMLGHASPTIDLRTDYHRIAAYGDLKVVGKVIKLGKTVSTADAFIYDKMGRLVASGRGVYFTSQSTLEG